MVFKKGYWLVVYICSVLKSYVDHLKINLPCLQLKSSWSCRKAAILALFSLFLFSFAWSIQSLLLLLLCTQMKVYYDFNFRCIYIQTSMAYLCEFELKHDFVSIICLSFPVKALKDIASTLGVKHLNLSEDPCLTKTLVITQDVLKEGHNSTIRCDCHFNNNKTCHITHL